MCRANNVILGVFKRVQQVLGSDVSCRTRRVGTSSEPSNGGIECPNAFGESRKDVSNRCAKGVVELRIFVNDIRLENPKDEIYMSLRMYEK